MNPIPAGFIIRYVESTTIEISGNITGIMTEGKVVDTFYPLTNEGCDEVLRTAQALNRLPQVEVVEVKTVYTIGG